MNDLVAKAEQEAAKYRKAGAVPAPAPVPAVQAAATPALVADELQKLARLRADGTITEQEFQGLKGRLLAR